MPKYSVIFDHDGTLMNNGLDEGRAVSPILASHGIAITPEQFAVRFASISSRKAYATLAHEAGIDLLVGFDKLAEQAILARAQRQGRGIAMPGMHALLSTLAESGTTLAVASGSSLFWLKTMLGQTEFDHFFQERVCSADEVREGKPAPDLLLYTAEKIGVPPEQCIYIGDGTPDIVASKAAGMKAIGLLAGDHCAFNPNLYSLMRQEGADHIAKSVGDLAAAIHHFQTPRYRPDLPRLSRITPQQT